MSMTRLGLNVLIYAADTIFVGRIAGAAVLAIGTASWVARADARTPAQLGLLTGILIYDAAAAILLAFAGLILKTNGVLLWPAVAIHGILAVWCLICLQPVHRGGAKQAPIVLIFSASVGICRRASR